MCAMSMAGFADRLQTGRQTRFILTIDRQVVVLSWASDGDGEARRLLLLDS